MNLEEYTASISSEYRKIKVKEEEAFEEKAKQNAEQLFNLLKNTFPLFWEWAGEELKEARRVWWRAPSNDSKRGLSGVLLYIDHQKVFVGSKRESDQQYIYVGYFPCQEEPTVEIDCFPCYSKITGDMPRHRIILEEGFSKALSKAASFKFE